VADARATWADALLAHHLPPDELLKILGTIPGLSGDAPAVLAGSVADNLANRVSDIDVYAVVSDDGAATNGLRAQIAAGHARRPLDINLIPVSVVNRLIEKLEAFARGGCLDAQLAESFSDTDRILLHRLNTGLAVQGQSTLAAMRERIGTSLVRHKYLCAFNMVKRRQATAQTLFEDSDWDSLLFIARDIVDSSADLLLAAAGDSSVGLKWRLKRLEAAFAPPGGASGSAGDLKRSGISVFLGPPPAAAYLRLSTFPPAPGPQPAYRYASAAVGWSRRAMLFAGLSLAGGVAMLEPAQLPSQFRRPVLTLDTSLAFADGRFALRRLRKTDPPWEISGEAALILCMFDGLACPDAPPAREVSRDVLERFETFLRQHDFVITHRATENASSSDSPEAARPTSY
jgi:hypothetical protein